MRRRSGVGGSPPQGLADPPLAENPLAPNFLNKINRKKRDEAHFIKMAKKSQKENIPSKVLNRADLMAGVKNLDRRIDDLSSFDVNTIEERFDAKITALTDKVNATLADVFGRDTPEYNTYSISSWSLDTLPHVMNGPKYPIPEVRKAYQKGIKDAITRLTSLRDFLEEKLKDLETTSPSKVEDVLRTETGRKVFIVHGHDELSRETVARFISALELDPIILHEQANQGNTIIEKLETHIRVDFAVVLLTPDDIGYPADDPKQARPRARQNVILELGLFLGSLSRKRVCALYKGDVEIPSDYSGVLFIPMDNAGAWKLKLAKEMKQAGMDVDMNKAI